MSWRRSGSPSHGSKPRPPPSRSPPSNAATTCTRPTARAATARTARAASARSLNRQDKLFAHLSEDYLNNVLEVGGRYVCGNPNSLMPVWSNEGHPPGPLNYIQIEDLIAFIRAPTTQTYTKRDPELFEPRARSDHRRGPDVHGLGRPDVQAGARRDAVPGVLGGRVRHAVRFGRRRRGRPRHRPDPGSPAASGGQRDRARSSSRRGSSSRPDRAHGAGRRAVRHRVRQPGRLGAARRRDQGLDRARSSSRARSSRASRRASTRCRPWRPGATRSSARSTRRS